MLVVVSVAIIVCRRWEEMRRVGICRGHVVILSELRIGRLQHGYTAAAVYRPYRHHRFCLRLECRCSRSLHEVQPPRTFLSHFLDLLMI